MPVLGPKFKGSKTFGPVKKAITSLTPEEIRAGREKGEIELEGHKLNFEEDILVLEKFVPNSVKEHEVIGGEKVFVLLDTRQDESLKVKGCAREIINRVQKLKKKAGLKAEDDVFIFYHFPAESTNLNKAIEAELESIKNAVKKPLFHAEKKIHNVNLGADKGEINGEHY